MNFNPRLFSRQGWVPLWFKLNTWILDSLTRRVKEKFPNSRSNTAYESERLSTQMWTTSFKLIVCRTARRCHVGLAMREAARQVDRGIKENIFFKIILWAVDQVSLCKWEIDRSWLENDVPMACRTTFCNDWTWQDKSPVSICSRTVPWNSILCIRRLHSVLPSE